MARNEYNGGHQSRGFESRFTEVILKLAWGPNNLSPGGIRVLWTRNYCRTGLGPSNSSPRNSWQDFCLWFLFFPGFSDLLLIFPWSSHEINICERGDSPIFHPTIEEGVKLGKKNNKKVFITIQTNATLSI